MRPDFPEWGLRIAEVVATRSTCLRRSVGCVLLDRQGRILATGYNGVARGVAHCDHNDGGASVQTRADKILPGLIIQASGVFAYPHACPGAFAASGTDLDGCHAIHAEQNALIQCRDPDKIHTCCCTASPCLTCVKLLRNTSCQHIVFREEYPHPAAQDLWLSGRTEGVATWRQIDRV